MASVGHVAVGIAAGRAGARTKVAGAMLLLAALSLLPDLDVIGFRFGVPYSAPFGHRGATHSLFVGVLVGVLVGAFVRVGTLSRVRAMILCAVVVCSHGLLDTLTDGGLGVALAWPLSTKRYFAPLRPIPVAPIGRRLFTQWGEHVVLTELLMFSPFLLYAFWPSRRGR